MMRSSFATGGLPTGSAMLIVFAALLAGCSSEEEAAPSTEDTGVTADTGVTVDSTAADSAANDSAANDSAANDSSANDSAAADTAANTDSASGDTASADGSNADGSADAPTDGAEASVDVGADAADASSATDAGPDAMDAATDAAKEASADVAADSGLCVDFTDTSALVKLTNVAQTMPTFTGGTITEGIYNLDEIITYTGAGGATGTSTGIYSQTQRFAGGVWSGVVTVPSSSTTLSFTATYVVSGAGLTFTKTCGTLNATSSNFTVVSANEIRLQSGGNSVQILKRP